MKVGDIFTDNGRILKVIDTDGEGRPVSMVIGYGEPEVKEEAKEEVPAEVEEAPKKRGRKPKAE